MWQIWQVPQVCVCVCLCVGACVGVCLCVSLRNKSITPQEEVRITIVFNASQIISFVLMSGFLDYNLLSEVVCANSSQRALQPNINGDEENPQTKICPKSLLVRAAFSAWEDSAIVWGVRNSNTISRVHQIYYTRKSKHIKYLLQNYTHSG